jgi:general secretion pathway protein I
MQINLVRPAHGFTLIEVLVAMAILVVAIAAANRASSMAINHSIEIRQRILADMVAQNRLSSHLVNGDWGAGVYSGTSVQAGIPFSWNEVITNTPNPAFMKVVVTVHESNQPSHQLRRLVGFIENSKVENIK